MDTDTKRIHAVRIPTESDSVQSDRDDFSCLRCGRCCRWPGYVRLSDSEVDEIAAYLGITVDEFVERHTRLSEDRSGLVILNRETDHCLFYEEGDPPSCRIQPVKPSQCRGFPREWNFPRWDEICRGGIERRRRRGEGEI
jgi:Fe-S-cluster containining protein